MCRFVLYQGPEIRMSSLITEPRNSLIHQSFHSHEREEPLNGDGFGVAWFVPQLSDEPAVFRSITPAWSNPSLRHLARVTRSACILAHVRAATPGLPVAEINTHPFSWRRFAFMHNGHVAGFQRIKRALIQRLSDDAFHLIQGTTDSEYVFALLADHLLREGDDGSAESLARALLAAVREVLGLVKEHGVEEPTYLNLALSDGRCSVVSRFTDGPPEQAESLYLHTGRRYVCEGGTCRMIDPDEGGSAVLVSSEALSDDPGWRRIPANHLVLIREDRTVEFQEMGLG